MEKLQLVKNIYVYALSGILLVICIVSLTNTLTSIPDILYPDSGYTQPFSEYKGQQNVTDKRSPEQIELDWQKNIELQKRDAKMRAIKNVFKSAMWTVVSGGAYVLFRRERMKIDNHKKSI